MTRLFLSALLGVLLCGPRAWGDALPVWRTAAVNPIGDSGVVFMAAKGGFGPAFGLDLQMVSMRGDPLLLKALVAGELDSYTGGPASPMIAAAKGAPVRIVGCNWIKQTYTFWGRGSVGGLADVSGKIVGIPSPGSSLDIFIRTALAGVGVTAGKVTFVVTGTPADSLRSLSAGMIDAAATPDEYAGRAKKIGLHPIASTLEVTPLALQRCYYVSADAMRLHKDLVVRFLAAEIAGHAYGLTHRAEAIGLSRVLMQAPADAEEPVAAFDNAVANQAVDLSFEVPLAKLMWMRDSLAADGHLSADFDPASIVDASALPAARALVRDVGDKAGADAEATLKGLGVR